MISFWNVKSTYNLRYQLSFEINTDIMPLIVTLPPFYEINKFDNIELYYIIIRCTCDTIRTLIVLVLQNYNN